jgi:hypothetical protein
MSRAHCRAQTIMHKHPSGDWRPLTTSDGVVFLAFTMSVPIVIGAVPSEIE